MTFVAVLGLAAVVGAALSDTSTEADSQLEEGIVGDAPPADAEKVFMQEIDAAGFGGKGTSDRAFINFGRDNVCENGFGAGLTYDQVVQGLVESDAQPTENQAGIMATSAVTNFCPEYIDQLGP